jgi:hypothetical protein
MTTTTGNTHTWPGGPGPRQHVLLGDDQGRLILRRLRPWHRVLARCAAARLDRELAAGASPETSAILAARAIQLTSVKFRRDLATSVQRILAAGNQLRSRLRRRLPYIRRVCRSAGCGPASPRCRWPGWPAT